MTKSQTIEEWVLKHQGFIIYFPKVWSIPTCIEWLDKHEEIKSLANEALQSIAVPYRKDEQSLSA